MFPAREKKDVGEMEVLNLELIVLMSLTVINQLSHLFKLKLQAKLHFNLESCCLFFLFKRQQEERISGSQRKKPRKAPWEQFVTKLKCS